MTNFVLFLIGCGIFFVGLVIGKFSEVPDMKLGSEINPVHLLSVLTTFTVALIIPVLFSRSAEKTSFKKSIFVKKIEKLQDGIESLTDLANRQELPYTLAASSTKKWTKELERIYESLDQEGIKVKSTVQDFQVKIHRLNKRLTDTPPHSQLGNSRPHIVVKENICDYSVVRIREIQEAANEIDSDLLTLMLQINNS